MSRWLTATRRTALDRGGLITLAILVLYVWVAPAWIVDIDNAEFATLGKLGGVAHPSGYPLYVLWLRALAWLPGSTPAHTAALATALLGALQIAVLHAACRAWGARPLAATIAVGIYAVSPLVLRYSTEAEVFALNGLIVAAVLWLAATAGPLRGAWRVGALALVAGLGMANNLTCTLVVPVGLVGAVRGFREARQWPAALGCGALGLALGWSPYLYLLVAPENLLSPQPCHSIGDVLDLVLRKQYGGALGFMSTGTEVPYGAHLAALVHSVGRSWLWGLAPLGLGMLAYRIARPRDGEARAGWIALAASVLLAGPLLATRFDVQDDNVGLYIVRRFHLLPTLLLAIPIAAGLDLTGRAFRRRVSEAVALALALAGVGVLALAALPDVARFHSPALDVGVRATLASLPPRAVVFGVTDELDVATRYLQLAEGVRPDVLYLRPADMQVPWYAARFARDGLTDTGSSLALARQVLAQGRPLFVASSQGDVIGALPNYPYGVLVRVLPRGATVPSLDEIVELNRALFATLALDYPTPGPHDEVATVVHIHYVKAWNRIGDALAAAGRADDAARAYQAGFLLAPLD